MIRKGCTQRRFTGVSLILAPCLMTIAAGPARAQVSGISYKFTPALENVWFADKAALKDGILYGGQLGFGFGRFIEVNGVYFLGSSFSTDFSHFTIGNPAADPLFSTLAPRDVRLSRYGGTLKFNLGHGNVFPYISLGTGVLAFEPDGLNRSETVYMSGTFGMQIGIENRYTIILQGSSFNYRYNPASSLLSSADLTTLGLTASDFGFEQVSSISAAVGLQFYLGGRTDGSLSNMDRALKRQMSSGWRGVGLRVEPVAAHISFSDALGYQNDQRMVGVAAGIDLGAYAGLRAFYWRGTEPQSWTDMTDLSAWGGELQLAFESSGGLTPFLTLGGGFMKAGADYVGNGLAPIDDRPFGVGGLGLVLPLGSTVNLVGSARSLLMSTSGVDNLSDPGTVKSNLMLSAILGFSFGGGGGETAGEIFGREFESSRAERERLSTELAAANTRIDSLATALSAQTASPGATPPPASATGQPQDAGAAANTTGNAQERWITVPVPREGELYLRFGKPGGVTVETIDGDSLHYYYDPATGALVTAPARSGASTPAASPSTTAGGSAASGLTSEQFEALMRSAMREESARNQAQSDSTAAAIRRLQQSLDARFTAMDAQLQEQRADFTAQLNRQSASTKSSGTQSPGTASPAAANQDATDAGAAAGTTDGASKESSGGFEAVRPMIGYNFNTPTQTLLGVRVEYAVRNQPYHLGLEYLLGVGNGDATNSFNLNAIYGRPVGTRYRPYLGAGIGLLDRGETDFVFNLLLGGDRHFDFGTAYLEFVTQNLFDNNRLLLGLRFGI